MKQFPDDGADLANVIMLDTFWYPFYFSTLVVPIFNLLQRLDAMYAVSLLPGLLSIGKVLFCFDGCLFLIVRDNFEHFVNVSEKIIAKRAELMNLLILEF